MSVVYKKRDVDYGNGEQYVELVDGTVTDQWLQSTGNHSYTGDGNPELVGKTNKDLHGYGFRKLTAPEQSDMLEQRSNY